MAEPLRCRLCGAPTKYVAAPTKYVARFTSRNYPVKRSYAKNLIPMCRHDCGKGEK